MIGQLTYRVFPLGPEARDMADQPKDRAQATLPEQSDGRPTLLIFERAGLDLNQTVEEETDDRNADLLERVDR